MGAISLRLQKISIPHKKLACHVLTLVALVFLTSSCTGFDGPLFKRSTWFSKENRYLESGSVIVSHKVPPRSLPPHVNHFQENPEIQQFAFNKDQLNPADNRQQLQGNKPRDGKTFAPLMGYFPPAVSYLPADNETWLEINALNKTLTLYKGKDAVKEIKAEGEVNLNAGDYFLQHKQKQPLWYAPNDYFAKRQLTIPPKTDRLRYRRGALGRFALFPTTTFPIHCAPVWTPEVGGLRISDSDLASIYYMLPVGAPIVVR